MPYRILVADDEELERRALRHILGGESGTGTEPVVQIVEAANGIEAMQKMDEGTWDAVFLDIRMPGMDGIRTARLMREKHPAVPIIFLTAHDSFEYARSALRLRVDDFLLKPASSGEVLAAFRRVIRAGSDGSLPSENSAAPGPAGIDRLKEALAYMAGEIRSGLAAGLVDCVKMERYLELSGTSGRIVAVVCLKAVNSGRAGSPAGMQKGGVSPFGSLAATAERAFGAYGMTALAGAGKDFLTCILAVSSASEFLSGNGGTLQFHEEVLRPVLSRIIEEARSELALQTVAGAAILSPAVAAVTSAAMVASAAATAVMTQGNAKSSEDLVRTARRASALANPANPVIIVELSATPDSGIAPEAIAGQTAGSTAGRMTVLIALELMERRHAEDLSLETVARELSVSPSHLSRILGKHAGMGFAECLARFRVEKSRLYLASGKCTIKEASVLSGFRDPGYFARVFRKFTGMNPGEYAAKGSGPIPGQGRGEELQ